MPRILLIALVYFLIHQSCASTHLENITVTYGENVKFHCPLPFHITSKDNIIQWKKIRSNEDYLTISINGKIPKIDEKFYRTLLTNQSSSLELLHANKKDSTTYICQTFETQTILCRFNLIVLIKPEAPLLTINKENIAEYQTVTLTCSSLNGNPSPQYIWYRNNVLLTSLNGQVVTTENNSTYTFNVTRYDNQVKYECQIWNQALTTPLRIEQYLHVKYRPYVKILEETEIFSSELNQIKKIIGIEHEQLNLTCHYDANPTPTLIYWITNGTTIVSREKVVYIPRLKSEQRGIYTCIVENSMGKVNQSIYLDVEYTPRIQSMESRIVANRSDSVVLRCPFDSNPLPYKIMWLKNNSQIIREQQSDDLYIVNVERNDSGFYTCIVFNRLYNNQTRNSSNTIELIVQSRPVIETTYSKIATELGQSIRLTCRVIAQPKPTIIWKHSEQTIPCTQIINDICYLHITKITMQDFGTYQCIAENLLGKEEWSYSIVSRGKPETPKDIIITDITSSSFKIQFTPAFDGGSGSQQFFIQVTDLWNASAIDRSVPLDSYEYSITGLNESTVYKVRIKSTNIYGESPWSHEIPVQTGELIITSDDLPQLHIVSYKSKEHLLQFEYAPDTSRLIKLGDEQLCLKIRQSPDGKTYHSIPRCLSIFNHRVKWKIEKDLSYLNLSICLKRYKHICGKEVQMNQEVNNRSFKPIIIGIFVMTSFLILICIILLEILYTRWRKSRLESNMNKFGINAFDKGVRPTISEPRLQNPYLLYSNSNCQGSPYKYDYEKNHTTSSFAVDDGEQVKDGVQCGATLRAATIHASPHWSRTNSRSGSNQSSESSCVTQHTSTHNGNIETDSNSNSNPVLISHYGFPPTVSPLKRHSSIIQSSSSSETSTPSRVKKLFYEVVV